ncbi:MAG: GntR family transcriptional regulator [Deltaproteobacteria bacterium]|nr:GntR family transcriptional regulator [Deltaproteobacteria bacterium]MBW2138607.1 GntR family transcriptional regulator [Deltaproteobacteria bacterium]
MEIKTITSVSEYLIDYLRVEIITGRLAPGEKIKEYQLAGALNVSRPILREVLRTLESEYLVDSIPRKGSYVSNISLEDFLEIYEIREMIECKAVELLKSKRVSVEPLLDEAIERESNLRVPSSGAPLRDYYDFFEKGLNFHLMLVNASGNRRLSQYYQGIQHNLLRYHVILGSKNLEKEVVIDHSDIAASLANGHYGKAKKILRAHINEHAQIIMKNIETQASLEAPLASSNRSLSIRRPGLRRQD